MHAQVTNNPGQDVISAKRVTQTIYVTGVVATDCIHLGGTNPFCCFKYRACTPLSSLGVWIPTGIAHSCPLTWAWQLCHQGITLASGGPGLAHRPRKG